MNEWLVAGTVLVACLAPLQWVGLRGRDGDALAALNQASLLAVTALVVMCEGFHRASFLQLPEVLAVLAFLGALAYARFLERWV